MSASLLFAALLTGLAAALAAVSAVLFGRWWLALRKRRVILQQLTALTRAATGAPGTQQIFRQGYEPPDRAPKLLIRSLPFLQDADILLEQAGLPWSRRTLARSMLGSGVAAAAAALLLAGSPLLAAAGLAAGAAAPYLYVIRSRAVRLRTFEEQLPEAIDLLSRAIRAGHAVPTGLRMVAEESADPLASEFRRVFEEQKYGLPFEDSLLALSRRVDLVDLRVIVVAILVQREVGGNLAEMLDKIAHLIRTRFRLRRQLNVYTAQARLSGCVLSLLPIALGLIISVIEPGYTLVLFVDPLGRALLGAAVAMQLAGYVWIWRTLRFDF